MASSSKSRPEVEQIDLTKLNLQQLQQLKTEFESVSALVVYSHMTRSYHIFVPNYGHHPQDFGVRVTIYLSLVNVSGIFGYFSQRICNGRVLQWCGCCCSQRSGHDIRRCTDRTCGWMCVRVCAHINIVRCDLSMFFSCFAGIERVPGVIANIENCKE